MGTGAHELLAEQPDRLRIRRPIFQPEAQEAHEGEAVADLELGLVVREIVERLQHQNLEHQHRIVGRATALATIGAAQRSQKRLAEEPELHQRANPLQRITRGRQNLVAMIEIEETTLTGHVILPQTAIRRENQIPPPMASF